MLTEGGNTRVLLKTSSRAELVCMGAKDLKTWAAREVASIVPDTRGTRAGVASHQSFTQIKSAPSPKLLGCVQPFTPQEQNRLCRQSDPPYFGGSEFVLGALLSSHDFLIHKPQ